MEHPERTDDGVGIGSPASAILPTMGPATTGAAKDVPLQRAILQALQTLLLRGDLRVVIGLAQHAGECL